MNCSTTTLSLLRKGLAAALLVATPSIIASDTAKWTFDVALDNRVVGTHKYFVSHYEGTTQVVSNASFAVKFLFFTAFEYEHSSAEHWAGNCLREIAASTNSNGKKTDVKGTHINNVLHVETGTDKEKLDGCVQSFAYWNPAILEADYLLNPQTGEHVKVGIEQFENERVSNGSREVDARVFHLSNDHPDENKRVDIKVWYTADSMQWLGLQSIVKGGRVLEYRAVSLPQRMNFAIGTGSPLTQATLQSETF